MRVKYLAHLADLAKIVGTKHTAQSFPQSRQNSLAETRVGTQPLIVRRILA